MCRGIRLWRRFVEKRREGEEREKGEEGRKGGKEEGQIARGRGGITSKPETEVRSQKAASHVSILNPRPGQRAVEPDSCGTTRLTQALYSR